MSVSKSQPPNDWKMNLDKADVRSWRQQALFVYGTGLIIGLYIALLQFAHFRSLAAFAFIIIGAILLSTSCWLLWRYALPHFDGLPVERQLLGQFASAVAGCGLLSFGLTEVYLWMLHGTSLFSSTVVGGPILHTIRQEEMRWAPLLYASVPIVPTALLCVGGYHLHWSRIRLLQAREREMRELAVSAQLAALRAQVNPHFFFNSLNSVAQLISTEPEKAEQCVERLAELFRYMLNRSDDEFVSLADELHFAEAYLEIEKARFGDDLVIDRDIDERVCGVALPGLILQPLVENAVKHGISKKIGGGHVRIEACLDHGDLRLRVADTGVGIVGRDTVFERGVGLRNVRDRLVKLYGPAYAPTISSTAGEGTTVTLRVPTDLALAGSPA